MYQNPQHKNRKLNIWLPLLFALVLVIGMLVGMRLQSESPTVVVESDSDVSNSVGQGQIEEVIRYIEAKYVDEVKREEMVRSAINNILEHLDPHSNYIPAEQLQAVNEQLEGNFEGIGVEFMILEDTIVVVTPLAGGPSDLAGIKAGDKIVEVEDSVIAGVNIETQEVMELLRGEKGTTVKVGVLRQGEDQIRQFEIKRDEIPLHSVDVGYMLNEETGYIKVNRFSATTYKEFMKNLETLVEERGMKNIVIDLRHNPGGYLQQATNILSQIFREKGKLLVYTKGRSIQRNEYKSSGRAFFNIEDVAILIDEGSASASEIVAGAIQDHDRGYIVGRRSFGKGLVQEQYRLRDGSALRLTVARYYTPSGRSIQRDYDNREAYEKELQARLQNGELSNSKRIEVEDSTKYYTDGGRVVYGGGGISPDIFVPLDTAFLHDHYQALRAHVPGFIYRMMEERAEVLESYELSAFLDEFRIDDAAFREFTRYAQEKGVEPQPEAYPVVAGEIKRLIKARLAKQLFKDKGFYMTWNEDDPFILEALEAIKAAKPITSSE